PVNCPAYMELRASLIKAIPWPGCCGGVTLPEERGPIEALSGRKTGTDRVTTLVRAWPREFQKASAWQGPKGSFRKVRKRLPQRSGFSVAIEEQYVSSGRG